MSVSIRRALIGLAGASALLFAVPVAAHGSVSMTASPPSSLSWTLVPAGGNTTSGGTITVQATEAYNVTVTADRTRLTEWITADGAYASTPKTLTAPLSVLTALESGLGVPVANVSVGTSSTTIATGAGTVLTPATDTYALTLSQTTAITDAALPSGRTYHVVLTYTASAAL